jgi:hypothetical protein
MTSNPNRWLMSNSVVLWMVLLAVGPVWGQAGQARVVVMDSAGARVGGAEVTVGERRGKADGVGIASFSGLPAGRFPVRVSSAGFETWVGELKVTNGAEAQVEARLEVADLGGVLVWIPGSMGVTVTDPSGAAVGRGQVVAVCADGGIRTAALAAGGAASIGYVPPGECVVKVTVPGFRVWETRRTVEAGESVTLAAKLELARAEEKIAVKPAGPLGRFKNWLTSCTTRR